MKFTVVIPARYASTRLPGKALRELAGRPMLQHVYERGCESSADEVVVATDDERIASTAEGFRATVCMTADHHQSGTERIAEVADILDWDDAQIVVNLQGDEPAMPASLIDQCASLLHDSDADIATLASPLARSTDFDDPNVVKVIRDIDGNAIYFSRAAIPFAREAANRQRAESAALHHHGIYAYRCGVLRELVAAAPADLEICEQLEQLRALSLGMTIAVGVPAIRPGKGVDTEGDLREVEQDLGS
ncbi:MAG: 3-deoxy-manno-octulosonate cytidylyltransferase [Gammaproteobacteria bacterium]|nr:3-deoxy-manno-octulosonate cytidylyltransferase [Gammaproteobacteria bacterium]